MTPIDRENCAICREQIFYHLSGMIVRAQAAQLLAQLGDDESLDLSLHRLVDDLRMVMLERKSLAEVKQEAV